MEETTTNILKQKNSGRRKIEIKKIEKKNNLQVTFSKRRKGLFKKAAELSILCGADAAILVQSPAGKVFASGGRAPINSIINRYLAAGTSTPSNSSTINIAQQQEVVAAALVGQDEEEEKKCLEIMKKIEVEKEKEKSLMQKNGDNAKGFWWEEAIDNLELNELEEYMAAMEILKKNVLDKAEEMANFAANNNNNNGNNVNENADVASSSILIPNVTIDRFAGLPIRYFESNDDKYNVDTNDHHQSLMFENGQWM